jgi:hypothetical protein
VAGWSLAAAAGVPAAGDSETCLEDKATVSWPFDSDTDRSLSGLTGGGGRARPSAPGGPQPGTCWLYALSALPACSSEQAAGWQSARSTRPLPSPAPVPLPVPLPPLPEFTGAPLPLTRTSLRPWRLVCR